MKLNSVLVMAVSCLFAAFFAGCIRIGNQVVQAPNPDDGVSGFYYTQPQSLTFYAQLSTETSPRICTTAPGTGVQQCANTTSNNVPALLSQVMTNPVGLFVEDTTNQIAAVLATDGSGNNMGVTFNPSNNTIAYLGELYPTTFWNNDSACQRQVNWSGPGSYSRFSTTQVDGNMRIFGRLTSEITITYTYSGCGTDLPNMATCYATGNCGTGSAAGDANLQTTAINEFGSYVNSGIIAPTDIANISYLSYQVSYQ